MMLSIRLADDLLQARLKKLKRNNGDWEADAFYIPMPISGGDRRPKLLPMAAVVDRNSGMVLKMGMRRQKGDSIEHMLMDTLTEAMLDHGRPTNLFVYSADMACAASNLCKQLNVQLHMEEEMPAMDEMLGELFSQMMNMME